MTARNIELHAHRPTPTGDLAAVHIDCRNLEPGFSDGPLIDDAGRLVAFNAPE